MRNKKTSMIGIIITVVVLIVVVIISNIGTGQMKTAQTVISNLFMPFQNGFVYLKNKLTSNEQEISDIASLKEENASLREKNSKLQESIRELEVLKSENNTLKEYVNLKNKYSEYTTVPANVIERSYSNYDKIVVINSGENDGVKVDMPVISESGLVGKVISVTEKTAKVQTIIDTASTVSASISTVTDSILLKGTLTDTQSLKAISIPVNTSVLQGDEVVTSGLGGIFPKGILIGIISEVVNTKNELDRYAVITPATDFSKLETVLVITNQ